jgi:SAM-dependent methyltransferase
MDTKGKQLLALYAYKASRPNELSFQAGDSFVVISRDSNGWWLAQAEDGKQGLVPRNYFSMNGVQLGEDGDNEESDQDEEYFSEYGNNVHIHAEMLQDAARTEAYRDAIMSHAEFIRGKTVLDVGCGTGVLSIFCARAGARKVYAVDASNMTVLTKEIVERNGLSEQVEVINGKIQDIELPRKVDVIVSEWMGTMLLFEGMLDAVLYARDRWLVEGGLMLPERAELFVAPVFVPEFYKQKVGFWDSVYGIDMSPLRKPAQEYWIQRPIITYDVRPHQVLAPPVLLKHLDMRTAVREELDLLETEWLWEQREESKEGGSEKGSSDEGGSDAGAQPPPRNQEVIASLIDQLDALKAENNTLRRGLTQESDTSGERGVEEKGGERRGEKAGQSKEAGSAIVSSGAQDIVVSGFVGWFDCHFGEPRAANGQRIKEEGRKEEGRKEEGQEFGAQVGGALKKTTTKEVTLSTAPVAEGGAVQPTHWKQSLFVYDEPMVVPAAIHSTPGHPSIECIAMMKRNESHPRHYHIALSMQVQGSEQTVQKCWPLWR